MIFVSAYLLRDIEELKTQNNGYTILGFTILCFCKLNEQIELQIYDTKKI